MNASNQSISLNTFLSVLALRMSRTFLNEKLDSQTPHSAMPSYGISSKNWLTIDWQMIDFFFFLRKCNCEWKISMVWWEVLKYFGCNLFQWRLWWTKNSMFLQILVFSEKSSDLYKTILQKNYRQPASIQIFLCW